MRAIYRLIAAASIAVSAMTGCQEEQFRGDMDPDNYYASVETFDGKTKTALGADRSVVWSADDRIAVFENGTGTAYQILDSYVGKSSGEFSLVEGLTTGGLTDAADVTVAAYPFDEGLNMFAVSGDTYEISGLAFPAEQTYTPGSFADLSFPMVAVTASGSRNLSFKNVGGVLKLSLTGDYAVSSITLAGNSGELLSGTSSVTIGKDGIPSVQMDPDTSGQEVTLLCDPAVQLDTETATDFYISIPPTDFEAGFTVTVLDDQGKRYSLEANKKNTVKRSSILAMPESTPESIDEIEITEDTFCSVDFVEGWTETRFGGDGTIVFVKEDELGRMTHTLMFLPDDENIMMPVYMRFDENEIPSYMSFMDTEIYIDGYTGSTVDFTLAVEEAVWSIKDVPCNELMPYSLQTRAWSDNNAIRNACAIGELIVGVAGVAGGVVMISASGIGAAMTAGASVPVSVAGIALGVMSIKGGCDSIIGSLETIFGPAEQTQSTYVKDGLMGIGMEKLSEAIENAPKKEFIKKKLPAAILKDPADLGKLGTISYWSGFIFSSIDEEWGKTYTGPADLAQVHQDVNVVTGRADNITEDSAELYGYVSPVATAPFGEKIFTEIYIVLWKASDKNTSKHHSTFNSDGGIISFTFNHLEADTEYCYQTIFEDLGNGFYRFGEVNTFKTKGEEDDRWVDLGLSVLWAAYNVGASSPEEYGGYYAWGETEEKSRYSYDTYKHRERDYDYYHLSPHSGDSCACWNYKFIGNEISGTSYDVATVKWGGGARMPTLAEVKELVNNCTFIHGTYNEIEGDYVTGPNGNSIFLPFAGYWDHGFLLGEGVNCKFWSGTYDAGYFDDNGNYAYYLDCDKNYGDWNFYLRLAGKSVRPVTEK